MIYTKNVNYLGPDKTVVNGDTLIYYGTYKDLTWIPAGSVKLPDGRFLKSFGPSLSDTIQEIFVSNFSSYFKKKEIFSYNNVKIIANGDSIIIFNGCVFIENGHGNLELVAWQCIERLKWEMHENNNTRRYSTKTCLVVDMARLPKKVLTGLLNSMYIRPYLRQDSMILTNDFNYFSANLKFGNLSGITDFSQILELQQATLSDIFTQVDNLLDPTVSAVVDDL